MELTDLPHLTGGFNELIGCRVEHLTTDGCVATLDVDERHLQPYGIVHGGVYATLAETVASTAGAAWAMGNGIPAVVGISNTTDFYRSQRTGTLRAEATPVHRGRSGQVWQVEITQQPSGKRAARAQVRLQHITEPGTIGGLAPGGAGASAQ
jgi:uncharacterized protein (TIGR00369 family)